MMKTVNSYFQTPRTAFANFRLLALLTVLLALIPFPLFASEGHQGHGSEAPASEQMSEDGETASDDVDKPLIDPDSNLYRVVKYAGKFHVMILHFPIAFLLGAAAIQWFLVFSGKGESTVAVMLWFGTLGAVAAAALGWMYAYDSVYFGESENILFWHRWLGTGTAAVTVVVLLLRKKLGTKGLAVALTLCAGMVGIAAHYGASLVYGSDFLLEF